MNQYPKTEVMRAVMLLLTAAIFSCANLQAQSPNASISGRITNAQQKPLAAVTVTLHRLADSALIKSAVTGDGGFFEITMVKPGQYFVEASLLGYKRHYSAAFSLAPADSLNMGYIALTEAAETLGGVVVKASKPMFEIKADKTVFNVEQSINAQGSNALELLQKSPGVQVDNNENISMKGKTGVRVYIDGRMMQLDARELANYLKSINSNDIEAIEMIPNPSAKYDASGNAGIVNIKLKKNKKYGTNGSVNLGLVQGITPKGNGSVNLNYRNKKVNVFGNVGGNTGLYANSVELYRIQGDTIYDQKSNMANNRQSANAKAGVDYFINSKHTVGIIGTLNVGNTVSEIEGVTSISPASVQRLEKSLLAFNTLYGNRTNGNLNFNYRYADTLGRELNIDADYGLFRGRGNSIQPNFYVDKFGRPINQFTYRNNTPTNIDIYTIKADYTQRAWKGNLGYGAKLAYVKTENAFEFFEDANNSPVLNANKSNRFEYLENVNAAYVNFSRSFGEKYSLQAGVRAEQTNSRGTLTRLDGEVQKDGLVKRNYIDFFPSAALSWAANKNNSIGLNYSRRIDRPSYQDLNPFENKLDELTYQKGNAFLRPQYTDNVELTHTFKGMITTSVGYSFVKDFATEITDTTNGNATFIERRNVAKQQIWSTSISAPLPINKWWNGFATVWFNYQMFEGAFANGTLKRTLPMYGLYVQNSFTLGKKGTTAEMSGWYNGPGVWGGTWETKPMANIDLGLQQPLFKKKASLKLSVTDVFFTQYWRAASDFGGLYIRGEGRNETRTFRLNFTYRFGKNEVKQARQRKTGLETEAERIKG
ncbi:MAG: TonB-dependent receptor [Bacteroidetes bacterium]|nr:MAG: TonB-dependent receptor [Bacteroidota bacterium]